MKHKILAQYFERWKPFEKKKNPKYDNSTINELIMTELDKLWNNFEDRMRIVPGKDVFSLLNRYLQENFKINLTPSMVIESFKIDEIPQDIRQLIEGLDSLNG